MAYKLLAPAAATFIEFPLTSVFSSSLLPLLPLATGFLDKMIKDKA